MVKNRKKSSKCPKSIRNKNKKTITKPAYENNTLVKTERNLIIGRPGCGKTFLMLSLSKDKNPDNVYIICERDSLFPSKYHNQSG